MLDKHFFPFAVRKLVLVRASIPFNWRCLATVSVTWMPAWHQMVSGNIRFDDETYCPQTLMELNLRSDKFKLRICSVDALQCCD